MKKVGFVGWRGMVGSVLMDRMNTEHDFNNFYSVFLSTSQIGESAPSYIKDQQNLVLQDAWDMELLSSLDIIVTCQGSAYSNLVYSKLRNNGWSGYWVDTASCLRMNRDAIIALDPVNNLVIERGISSGIKTFIGGNCTVSLMLMALGGLFNKKLIDWISVATYQAASGYGAQAIKELLIQMGQVYKEITELLQDPSIPILKIEHLITNFSKTNTMLVNCFKVPLIGNVIPWIGDSSIMYQGQTQEEWKGQSEVNKILNTSEDIPMDSLCVRVCSLRCHSQVLTIKLKKNLCISVIEDIIRQHNIWVDVVPNDYYESLSRLTPLSVSGTLRIGIGRLHKMNVGEKFLSAFTVGDQLIWGAAEPIRRILLKLVDI